MSEPMTSDEWAQEYEDNWYYEEVSQARCPCGELLWGVDWWDGWKDSETHRNTCESCGQGWVVEVEHPEPVVVGLRASG